METPLEISMLATPNVECEYSLFVCGRVSYAFSVCVSFYTSILGNALRNLYFNFRKLIRSIDASSVVVFKVLFFFHM